MSPASFASVVKGEGGGNGPACFYYERGCGRQDTQPFKMSLSLSLTHTHTHTKTNKQTTHTHTNKQHTHTNTNKQHTNNTHTHTNKQINKNKQKQKHSCRWDYTDEHNSWEPISCLDKEPSSYTWCVPGCTGNFVFSGCLGPCGSRVSGTVRVQGVVDCRDSGCLGQWGFRVFRKNSS